jgi:HAD superfamily hydrolase (TIGR01509 family)
MIFEGIIFDFNGVLWWDSHLQEEAWSQTAQALRGRPLSSAEMSEHVHGRPNAHSLAYLLGRPLDQGEIDRLTQQKEQLYRELCLAQGPDFRLSPGAVPLLDHLAAHAIRRTIATASEITNVTFFAGHLDLGHWFDVARIVYDDGRLPGKPAPDVYLEAARRLGLPPAACVVVEDSRSGLAAAHAAGIGHIVALGPAADQAALRALPGVGRVISSLADLPRSLFA